MKTSNLLKSLFLTILILQVINLTYAQSDRQKGCWAKNLIHDQYEYGEESYPVYTGEYNDSLDFLESIELVLAPSLYDWIYVKKSNNCEPPNHANCFELSREFFKEDVIELTIVSDTNKTSNYVWEVYELKELIEFYEEKKRTDWVQVPCGRIHSKLKEEVVIALYELGYISEIKDYETIEVKEAVLNIQKRNGLGGQGNVTIELLEFLGIS